MPGISVPSRRGHSDVSDDDDDGSDASDAVTPASQTSSVSKKARLSPGFEEDEDESQMIPNGLALSDGNRSIRASQSANKVDPEDDEVEEHPPGSIVRVKLVDFVTYTSAEFLPGPRLNMIIGPNGTGKSTLVCAICLGLGFGTAWLGRAKDVSEFVKHGCSEATIEIELKRHPKISQTNFVVKRNIKRENNKSLFWINGQAATRKDISDLCQKLSIQVDNLCQFLPQEKVSEFARMDPVFLLHETQRAVGKPQMLEWHDNLKTFRKEQKKLTNNLRLDKEVLRKETALQEQTAIDLERIRERENLEKRVKLLKLCRPLPKYKEAQSLVGELRQRRDEAAAACDDLKRSVEPTLRAVNAKQEYKQKLELVVNGVSKERLAKTEAEVRTKRTQIETYDEKSQELENSFEQERRNHKSRKDDERRINGNIDRVKRQIESVPEEFDAAGYNEKIREKEREMRDLANQEQEAKTKIRQLAQRRDQKALDVQSARRQLVDLDSQAGQQELRLRKVSEDSATAWRWIKENQHQFEHEILGPPMVTCSIKDPKYVDAVESLLNRGDVLAFTCRSNNDFRTLQAQLSGTMKLHDTTIRQCSRQLEDVCRRNDDQNRFDLGRHGFDGWALDYISGPSPVLAMLCVDKKLHLTPIRLRDISEDEYEVLSRTGLGAWVAGRTQYGVRRRREYGPNAVTNITKTVNKARTWTDQPVNVGAKRELEEKIVAWTQEHKAFEDEIKNEQEIRAPLRPHYMARNDEKEALLREKSEKQSAATAYRQLPIKLERYESELLMLQEANAAGQQTRRDLVQQIGECALNKANAVVTYTTAVETLRQVFEDHVQAQVRLIEAASDFETLEAENSHINKMLKEKEKEVGRAKQETQQATEQAKKMRREIQQLKDRGDEELQAMLVEVSHMDSPEKLEADIESAYAGLEIIQGGHQANTLKTFEARAKKIDQLTGKIDSNTQELNQIADGINDIRGRWEPELDALAERISAGFSHNMAQIGCAGQVSIYKADDEPDEDEEVETSDFEKWGIHIRVKFREHEPLQLLTAHRQSGGERSVSTIFYLMALQSLSASPFRVVDEINQGMDPRNERKVHERMVDIACDRGGSQYFLITPKLLTSLKYGSGMTVLIIVSGEYVPVDARPLDFNKCIEAMKEVKLARRITAR